MSKRQSGGKSLREPPLRRETPAPDLSPTGRPAFSGWATAGCSAKQRNDIDDFNRLVHGRHRQQQRHENLERRRLPESVEPRPKGSALDPAAPRPAACGFAPNRHHHRCRSPTLKASHTIAQPIWVPAPISPTLKASHTIAQGKRSAALGTRSEHPFSTLKGSRNPASPPPRSSSPAAHPHQSPESPSANQPTPTTPRARIAQHRNPALRCSWVFQQIRPAGLHSQIIAEPVQPR